VHLIESLLDLSAHEELVESFFELSEPV